jgi:hypothetical protein
MRKITKLAADAFNNGLPFKMDNTEVVVNHDALCGRVTQMYLFDNLIAEHTDFGLSISDGGYPLSMTTADRLRGLGVCVYFHRKQAYLGNEPWDGSWHRIKH